jgi:hypothetical protein
LSLSTPNGNCGRVIFAQAADISCIPRISLFLSALFWRRRALQP